MTSVPSPVALLLSSAVEATSSSMTGGFYPSVEFASSLSLTVTEGSSTSLAVSTASPYPLTVSTAFSSSLTVSEAFCIF